MDITIWGTRGSVPVASQETTRFGGNTTCIEINTDAGDRIILDAGTGIRALGESLISSGTKKCTLCLTHAHWDHLQGLPFFKPMYLPDWSVDIYGPVTMGQGGVKASLEQVFNGRNFPMELGGTGCALRIVDFEPGESFLIGDAIVQTCPTVHPGGCSAYRVTADGWSFVFTGDHECCPSDALCPDCIRLEQFISRADTLLADAQYTAAEYAANKGWGHSRMDYWPELAARAGVKHLLLTHHDPTRTDEELDSLSKGMNRTFSHLSQRIHFAYEGMRMEGDEEKQLPALPDKVMSCWLCDLNQEFSRYSDVGMILDSILTQARTISRADAGTVYLAEGKELVFAYAQNQTLFSGSNVIRQTYLNARIPLSLDSIAGYAAVTRSPLVIDDAWAIAPDAPYRFNSAMDTSSGYRTVSMFTVPLLLKGRMLGVLQLINAMGPDGAPCPFPPDVQERVILLADTAVMSLERGMMANELILRMLEMAALRDPAETAGHVRRVGAMAAEIYHSWAERHAVDPQEMRQVKDHIRLAAMLHDVGKVGIADAVLKKPGALTPEERSVMQQHCMLGARLFSNVDWAVDAMALEIARHHHQRWDGRGYTGDPEIRVLAGDAIPLPARITAIADVYDALISPRCYKAPMPRERALSIMKEERGKHFDPEVVDAFLSIIDVVDAINSRYLDSKTCTESLLPTQQ